MATNLSIDPELLDTALEVGGEKTKEHGLRCRSVVVCFWLEILPTRPDGPGGRQAQAADAPAARQPRQAGPLRHRAGKDSSVTDQLT